jgi:hypothetical protein
MKNSYKLADMSKSQSPGLTVFRKENAAILKAYRQCLHVLAAQGFCGYGQYPWDAWQCLARLHGVPEDLAVLGRATMREAYQHNWSDRFRLLCGWGDMGQRMIALALRSPKTARQRWEWLLETDGQRVDPWDNYEWVGEDAWTWPRRRRQWLKQRQSK